jgi:hypothetical protein
VHHAHVCKAGFPTNSHIFHKDCRQSRSCSFVYHLLGSQHPHSHRPKLSMLYQSPNSPTSIYPPFNSLHTKWSATSNIYLSPLQTASSHECRGIRAKLSNCLRFTPFSAPHFQWSWPPTHSLANDELELNINSRLYNMLEKCIDEVIGGEKWESKADSPNRASHVIRGLSHMR